MEKLILWEVDESFAPQDPEERMKHIIQMCELVKADLESGTHTNWGIAPGGGHGYALTDKDEKEVFATLAKFIPYVKFKVEPMVSIDEVIAILKSAQE